MPERPRPDLDRVRAALAEHDKNVEPEPEELAEDEPDEEDGEA